MLSSSSTSNSSTAGGCSDAAARAFSDVGIRWTPRGDGGATSTLRAGRRRPKGTRSQSRSQLSLDRVRSCRRRDPQKHDAEPATTPAHAATGRPLYSPLERRHQLRGAREHTRRAITGLTAWTQSNDLDIVPGAEPLTARPPGCALPDAGRTAMPPRSRARYSSSTPADRRRSVSGTRADGSQLADRPVRDFIPALVEQGTRRRLAGQEPGCTGPDPYRAIPMVGGDVVAGTFGLGAPRPRRKG